jgi:hypothetical protein
MDDGVFYPQIEFINEIHEESPNATFVLMFRDISDWYQSLSHWWMGGAKKHLNEVIERVNITGLPPGKGKNETEIGEWFCSHVQNIRHFVELHPTHTLIEVSLYDPDAGSKLGALFGVNGTCWGHHNRSPLPENVTG